MGLDWKTQPAQDPDVRPAGQEMKPSAGRVRGLFGRTKSRACLTDLPRQSAWIEGILGVRHPRAAPDHGEVERPAGRAGRGETEHVREAGQALQVPEVPVMSRKLRDDRPFEGQLFGLDTSPRGHRSETARVPDQRSP